MKKLFLCLIIFFTSVSVSFAVCGGSSPNLVAADATQAEVQLCVAASAYGDTITIPAGTETWTSGILITKNIKIVGNGVGSTVITNGLTNNSADEAFFKFVPDWTSRNNLDSLADDTDVFDISNIEFTYASTRMPYKYPV